MVDIDRARKVVVASFLGWTLDAFDFFIMVFVFSDIAKEFGVVDHRRNGRGHPDAGDARRSALSSLAGSPTVRPPPAADARACSATPFSNCSPAWRPT